MTFQLTTRRALLTGALGLAAMLYLADLTGMGMVSADEPRYADIGRAMAQSGDWITPRLWGSPWFEKPPLLYWMTAAGFRLRLGPDLAPRLPVALLSLGFLGLFWWRLRQIWDERTAWYSSAILATTAGWLAYSHVAVTDLPLSAFFTAAVLFAMPPYTSAGRIVAGGALALAVLSKSLVPLVLFVPVMALNGGRPREWLRAALAFTLIVLPWHVLCTLRNGGEFLRVLFLQQQFGRFFSPELQHARPVWYYGPVFLLFLYPWFPLIAILPLRRGAWRDRRVLTLLAVVLFGFAFFSLSINKLPGYVLPLVPSVCALMGVGLARMSRPGIAAFLPIALLGALPFGARIVPAALAAGLRAAPAPVGLLSLWIPVATLAGVAVLLLFRERAAFAAAATAAAALLCFQFVVFPAIDAAASARPLWRRDRPTCTAGRDRALLFGLYYYSGQVLPPCKGADSLKTDK